MKKILALFLIIAMFACFVACGKSEPEVTPKSLVIERAEWDVEFELTYNGYKMPSASVTTIKETSENQFEIYGTFTAKNQYNGTVSGTFDGTGKYNPETNSADVDVDLR